MEAMMGRPYDWWHGYDLMRDTGLASGSLYPALIALREQGMVESYWEDAAVALSAGRPPRRYYRLTDKGRAA